jgi:hypothetical protein
MSHFPVVESATLEAERPVLIVGALQRQQLLIEEYPDLR